MQEKLEEAIKTLAKDAAHSELAHEAMNFAQAALNLAHALVLIKKNIET
jgi:hypothetical protein